MFVGTFRYAAPEQFQGQPVDGRTDQYALACVVYECLAGAPPFPGNSDAEMMFGHLWLPPPQPSLLRDDIGPEVDRVLAKAMAKTQDERFATCGEMTGRAAERAGRRHDGRGPGAAGAARADPGAAPPPPVGIPPPPPVRHAPTPPVVQPPPPTGRRCRAPRRCGRPPRGRSRDRPPCPGRAVAGSPPAWSPRGRWPGSSRRRSPGAPRLLVALLFALPAGVIAFGLCPVAPARRPAGLGVDRGGGRARDAWRSGSPAALNDAPDAIPLDPGRPADRPRWDPGRGPGAEPPAAPSRLRAAGSPGGLEFGQICRMEVRVESRSTLDLNSTSGKNTGQGG